MTRRKFSREFKLEAVKLVTERGVSVAHEHKLGDPSWAANGAHPLVQTPVVLTTGDTAELQPRFQAADGYFAAD